MLIKKSNGTLLDALKAENIYINVPCNGRGTCGKCKVKILDSAPPATMAEKNLISFEELEAGFRLACYIPSDMTYDVEIDEKLISDKDFSIVSFYEHFDDNTTLNSMDGYGVGIDIGTTTIALELFDLRDGKLLKTHTLLNSQRAYGSDVISRIDHANKGGLEELNEKIISDLKTGLKVLVNEQEISKVTLAGNTTMLHLLMKSDCSGLGVYPFTATFLDMKIGDLAELFGISGQYTLLAGISTYVGSDILSGIMHTNMHKNKSVCILIDIGTNGEMAIGNQDSIITLATAAGPAFEGGNISCGLGSIKGAICQVNPDKTIKTIGDQEPLGICGSGLIDAIAIALANEDLDDTGFIENDEEIISITDHIFLTQKDIREFQLAKSAIRAGIEVLMIKYGIEAKNVDKVYLAGGFGKFINLENALTIGLLPKAFNGKIYRVGNTSLGGVRKFLLYNDIEKEVDYIKSIAKDLNLAHDPLFNELFMEHMLFEQ